MKIAFRGDKVRHQEIINILISIGGNNVKMWTGNDNNFCYFVNEKGIIDACNYKKIPYGYACYTLNDFEKKFQLRIGQKATTVSNSTVTIIDYVISNDDMPYYKVSYEWGTTAVLSKASLLYKQNMENNEVRTVTLSIEKAREWYQSGDVLKELALQVYTENELNPLPKTWEEFLRKFDYRRVVERAVASILLSLPQKYCNKYAALLKLNYLMDYYRNGWTPNWKDDSQNFCIKMCNPLLSVARFRVYPQIHTECFFAFQSKEVAEEFLKNFEPLMIEAGDLIAY